MNDGALIEAGNTSFGYAGKIVVHLDALQVRPTQCLGIFGANGSGKSTLLRGLAGLLMPMQGELHRTRGLRVGLVGQQRSLDTNWPMSALDAASMALSARGPFGWLGSSKAHVAGSMQALGVDQLASKRFKILSGGQQQRVMLAGALALDPQILFLDEPADGLDLDSRSALLNALRNYAASGMAVVYVSHDADELIQLCQDILWIHQRREEAQPSSVEQLSPAQFAERLLVRRAAI